LKHDGPRATRVASRLKYLPAVGRYHGQSDSGHAFATVSDVIAGGVFSNATNIFGKNNDVETNATASWAFNALGSNNLVLALPGPLAVAGSIGQTGQTIKKAGPGFHINGVVVGGAAAVGSPKTATPTTAALRTGKKTAAPAAATRTTRTPAPAAASGRGSSKK